VLAGDEAAQLGDWLAEATAQWRGWADEVAKHLVSLGVPPDGRVRSLAEDIPLNWVPKGWLSPDEGRGLLVHRLGTVAARARYRRSQATDGDTRDLLDRLCASLETRASEVTHPIPPRKLGQRNAKTVAEILPGRMR
jgi:hypothetical protein